MRAWLCGLDDEEILNVSSVLTFIGIEHSTSFTAFHLPDFVVIGHSVECVQLDELIPVISLNTSLDIIQEERVEDNIWFCPLPWRSQDFWSVLKEIQQKRLLPQPSGVNLNLRVRHLEALLIRQALLSAQGVVSRAAENLQIQRTTLIEKMRRYNIDKSEF